MLPFFISYVVTENVNLFLDEIVKGKKHHFFFKSLGFEIEKIKN